jgi:soluble lytic murein transglycosylase
LYRVHGVSDNRTMKRIGISFMHALRAVVAISAAAVATQGFAQSDADFLVARTAFERGDWRTLDAVAPALAGHVLERYVRYWQLKGRLDEATSGSVHEFIARYPDGPLPERLRVEWLKALGKRGDWNQFALDYSPPSGEDTELACYAIQFRYTREGASALASAKPLWFNGQSTPDSCEPLFAALIARGDLALGERRARVRLAAAAGNTRLAQAIGDDLPGRDRIPVREFAAIERDPLRGLAKGHFDWQTPSGRELALYALERAARKDAGEAHGAWVKWRARLPEADRDYGNSRIAYHAARQLHPSANAWFGEVRKVALTPDQQTWRVRAALRAGAWHDVRHALDALPAADQQEAVWRFWRARTLAGDNAVGEARAIYESLATDIGYYGLLAGEALGRGSTQLAGLAREPLAINDASLTEFGARPAIVRAVKLAQLDVRLESIREWNQAIRGFDDERLLLAAEYARRAGLYDRAINTAERTAARHDFALRYLTPYRTEFSNAAREQGIDEELLYGIARQESRFVPDIVSSAGAVGLMQLMPGTARWVAKQLTVADYTPSRIASVDVNTQFGAYYFKYWQERLGRLPALAAAAYNAGPSRAQAWRPATGSIEGAIWVETIPFNETRDYVKRVLANTMLYTRALDRPYVPLTQRLGVVTPRSDDALAAAAP